MASRGRLRPGGTVPRASVRIPQAHLASPRPRACTSLSALPYPPSLPLVTTQVSGSCLTPRLTTHPRPASPSATSALGPALHPGLPVLQDRSYPRAPSFAPLRAGGLNMPHPALLCSLVEPFLLTVGSNSLPCGGNEHSIQGDPWMRPCSQAGSTRELGIFHFLSKLWVQKALTGGVTKGVTRPERVGQGRVRKGHWDSSGCGGWRAGQI